MVNTNTNTKGKDKTFGKRDSSSSIARMPRGFSNMVMQDWRSIPKLRITMFERWKIQIQIQIQIQLQLQTLGKRDSSSSIARMPRGFSNMVMQDWRSIPIPIPIPIQLCTTKNVHMRPLERGTPPRVSRGCQGASQTW